MGKLFPAKAGQGYLGFCMTLSHLLVPVINPAPGLPPSLRYGGQSFGLQSKASEGEDGKKHATAFASLQRGRHTGNFLKLSGTQPPFITGSLGIINENT